MINNSWAIFLLQCNEEKRIQNGFCHAKDLVIPEQMESGVLYFVPMGKRKFPLYKRL